MEDAAVAHDGQLGQPQESSIASSSVGASSSSQAIVAVPCVAPAAQDGEDVGQHGQQAEHQRLPAMTLHQDTIMLEGAVVHYEKHGQRGQPGSYERLRARCPTCKKEVQRPFSTRLAAASGLADQEPYAYVGVWLSMCSDSHKSWKPDAAETKEYARIRQWI